MPGAAETSRNYGEPFLYDPRSLGAVLDQEVWRGEGGVQTRKVVVEVVAAVTAHGSSSSSFGSFV